MEISCIATLTPWPHGPEHLRLQLFTYMNTLKTTLYFSRLASSMQRKPGQDRLHARCQTVPGSSSPSALTLSGLLIGVLQPPLPPKDTPLHRGKWRLPTALERGPSRSCTALLTSVSCIHRSLTLPLSPLGSRLVTCNLKCSFPEL